MLILLTLLVVPVTAVLPICSPVCQVGHNCTTTPFGNQCLSNYTAPVTKPAIRLCNSACPAGYRCYLTAGDVEACMPDIFVNSGLPTTIGNNCTLQCGYGETCANTQIGSQCIRCFDMNESFNSCGNLCEVSCQNGVNPQNRACMMMCGPPACTCVNGYYRDQTNRCVPSWQCAASGWYPGSYPGPSYPGSTYPGASLPGYPGSYPDYSPNPSYPQSCTQTGCQQGYYCNSQYGQCVPNMGK